MDEQPLYRKLRAVFADSLWAQPNPAQLVLRWLAGGLFLVSGVSSLLDWPAAMDFFQIGHRIT